VGSSKRAGKVLGVKMGVKIDIDAVEGRLLHAPILVGQKLPIMEQSKNERPDLNRILGRLVIELHKCDNIHEGRPM
jgi:hypothetical protein